MLHNSFDGTTGAGPTNQRATVPPLRSAARAAHGCVSCVELHSEQCTGAVNPAAGQCVIANVIACINLIGFRGCDGRTIYCFFVVMIPGRRSRIIFRRTGWIQSKRAGGIASRPSSRLARGGV